MRTKQKILSVGLLVLFALSFGVKLCCIPAFGSCCVEAKEQETPKQPVCPHCPRPAKDAPRPGRSADHCVVKILPVDKQDDKIQLPSVLTWNVFFSAGLLPAHVFVDYTRVEFLTGNFSRRSDLSALYSVWRI